MTIVLTSQHMETLINLLKTFMSEARYDLPKYDLPNVEVKSTMCTLKFHNDRCYHEMSLFCSNALAIGLVSSIHIER